MLGEKEFRWRSRSKRRAFLLSLLLHGLLGWGFLLFPLMPFQGEDLYTYTVTFLPPRPPKFSEAMEPSTPQPTPSQREALPERGQGRRGGLAGETPLGESQEKALRGTPLPIGERQGPSSGSLPFEEPRRGRDEGGEGGPLAPTPSREGVGPLEPRPPEAPRPGGEVGRETSSLGSPSSQETLSQGAEASRGAGGEETASSLEQVLFPRPKEEPLSQGRGPLQVEGKEEITSKSSREQSSSEKEVLQGGQGSSRGLAGESLSQGRGFSRGEGDGEALGRVSREGLGREGLFPAGKEGRGEEGARCAVVVELRGLPYAQGPSPLILDPQGRPVWPDPRKVQGVPTEVVDRSGIALFFRPGEFREEAYDRVYRVRALATRPRTPGSRFPELVVVGEEEAKLLLAVPPTCQTVFIR